MNKKRNSVTVYMPVQMSSVSVETEKKRGVESSNKNNKMPGS